LLLIIADNTLVALAGLKKESTVNLNCVHVWKARCLVDKYNLSFSRKEDSETRTGDFNGVLVAVTALARFAVAIDLIIARP
jgi:hypothetical protein